MYLRVSISACRLGIQVLKVGAGADGQKDRGKIDLPCERAIHETTTSVRPNEDAPLD